MVLLRAVLMLSVATSSLVACADQAGDSPGESANADTAPWEDGEQTANNSGEQDDEQNDEQGDVEQNEEPEFEPTVEIDPVPSCSSQNAPDRCTVPATEAEWGRAAILIDFFLEGIDYDPVCCADVDGDGELDNSLGRNLDSWGVKAAGNSSQEARISRGEDVVILEFREAVDGAPDIQWWSGSWSESMDEFSPEGNEVTVSPTDIDAGHQSKWWIPDADSVDGYLAATSGLIEVPIVILDIPLRVPAHVMDAEVDVGPLEEEANGPEVTGRLAVLLEVADIYGAFNEVAHSCECLGLGTAPYIDDAGTCSEEVNADRCEREGRPRCSKLVDACTLFTVGDLFADQSIDEPDDAISAGFSFRAYPAEILGVTGNNEGN